MLASKGLITCPCPVPVSLSSNRPIFDHANVDPFPNQSQDSSVTDPFLDHLYEQAPDDRVEVSGNVRFQNCRDGSATNNPAHFVQRILWSATRPESVATVQKILLVDRVEQIDRRLLHDLIFQRRYRDRPLPSASRGM